MKPILATLATLLLLGSAPAFADDCAQAAADAQSALDRVLADLAANGPSAPEGDDALLSEEPTPNSIAQTEAELGDGTQPEVAQKALDRARAAAAAGNEDACQKEVAAAREAIGLK
ncbi:hypothetical protein [Ancylobacter pratisalsi]|uniref:Uncharacterized protein n=1 Tax=Ancylobacter pratisalsi TaxID=1745854 RepID=A0A6P1YKG5_9HYPH|nr:hypothetical protein [Ancylobacter pratisalsi]QIB33799.1 hypothetical protein G3A50_08855 [Ancylobacter pratisalsi]